MRAKNRNCGSKLSQMARPSWIKVRRRHENTSAVCTLLYITIGGGLFRRLSLSLLFRLWVFGGLIRRVWDDGRFGEAAGLCVYEPDEANDWRDADRDAAGRGADDIDDVDFLKGSLKGIF